MAHSFCIDELSATKQLAHQIAQVLTPNMLVTLNGDLGVGKTTLTRLILQELGVSGAVKSPTFTLVEPYAMPEYIIYHFDLYRFSDPEEWFDAGFDEYFNQPFLSFIEWAENAEGLLPPIDWQMNLTLEHNERCLEVHPRSAKGELCLEKLISNVAV